jgi:hypothetical protein
LASRISSGNPTEFLIPEKAFRQIFSAGGNIPLQEKTHSIIAIILRFLHVEFIAERSPATYNTSGLHKGFEGS